MDATVTDAADRSLPLRSQHAFDAVLSTDGVAVELRVLGSLEVLNGAGDAVPLASTAQRRLTGILVAHDGSVVSADRLSHELGISKGGLQTAVSWLRKLLGAEYVVTESPGYALRGVIVDAVAFEDEVDRARSAEPHHRAEILDRALRRWRDDAYLEFADEEWARGPAVRLSELRATASEDRAEVLISIGSFADAVALLVEHIDRYPLRDPARAAHAQPRCAGTTERGVAGYRSYRTYLGETVGTEPSSELQTLERKIVGGWRDVRGGVACRWARRRRGRSAITICDRISTTSSTGPKSQRSST